MGKHVAPRSIRKLGWIIIIGINALAVLLLILATIIF